MSNKPDFPNKVFLHPCKDEASFVFSSLLLLSFVKSFRSKIAEG
jgi:hypothetical protein